MLDSYIRPLIAPPLTAMARTAVKRGIGANHLTFAGFVFSLGAFAGLGLQAYGAALFFIAASRLMDGLDGAVARNSAKGPSDFGAICDIVADFIFYGGIPFFFAVGRPDAALPAAFLIFSFMGTAGSFLAYGLIAAKRGQNHDRQGRKSFYYADGLCEGSETVAFFVLFCLLPDYFTSLAAAFGLLCWATTAQRVALAARNFS